MEEKIIVLHDSEAVIQVQKFVDSTTVTGNYSAIIDTKINAILMADILDLEKIEKIENYER